MSASHEKRYERLITMLREIELLDSCSDLLHWDQETYMPEGGADHRAEQLALLAGMVHAKNTSPELGELLGELEGSALVSDPQSPAAVNVRETRRTYERATKVPTKLVEEIARTTSLARSPWVEARTKSDFSIFQPWLEKIVALKQQEAEALGYDQHPYDALLDDYEPGATSAGLATLFDPLRSVLSDLLKRIVDSPVMAPVEILARRYPITDQETFGRRAAEAIRFNFTNGRLDVTTHPFCSGIGPGDTRITTRYDEHDFGNALFSILHECGHGIYDQGLDPEHFGTPMGSAVSLGVHESQSRLWENYVGRSRAFWQHFLPQAQATFPEALSDVSQEDFYRAINDVRPSFIRTESDEVTYNLHIFLRFELERGLITGDLQASDVPQAWNDTFERDFGLRPPDDARGCLQDIHWSGGGIGYFPTYTLGNLYGAQFFARARAELGNLDGAFSRGEFEPLKTWLNEKIHRQGQRWRGEPLVEVVTGSPPSYESLAEHLETKYGELYKV